uniref:NADH-ubiquinone oxidoreductase chain 6 n=1 Tax=Aegorhinus superciliosus TaxID=1448030 RepID=A0A0K0K9I4_9CUCU|nr:NADH dehydrogenase subunit 6 [Aegorhinus superciliosus]AHG32670.1 NADH dehydrogenase subunit 6 [Aegorhinus superciliosus]
MLMSMLITSWILALTFMALNHPLSFGLIIILQTTSIALSSGLLNFNFWFSYILFLIMIGGMMILFIYMTSIASNEKFTFSKKLTLLGMLSLMLLILLMMMDYYPIMEDTLMSDSLSQNKPYINLSMSKYLNMPNILVMILLMVYLLVTLIAIVKIIHTNFGPLRQKF